MNSKFSKFGFVTKGLIKKYNAKPFLARTSTAFEHVPQVLFGVEIDIHLFSFAARKGLHAIGLRDTLASGIIDIGFVIEGREDRELPEQMLSSVRISKLNLDAICGDEMVDVLTKRYLADQKTKK